MSSTPRAPASRSNSRPAPTASKPKPRFKLSWILGGALLLAFVAWLRSGPTRSRADYSRKPNAPRVIKNLYNITPAPGWRVVPLTGALNTNFIARSPLSDKYAANFNVTDAPADGITIEQEFANLPRYAQALPGYLQRSARKFSFDGAPALEHVATYTRSKRPVRLRQIIAVRNNRALVFTATCREIDLDLWQPDMDAMFSSVRWVKTPAKKR